MLFRSFLDYGVEELFVYKWVSFLHKTIEKDLEFGAIRNSIFTKLYSDDNPCCPDFVKLYFLYISPMNEWFIDYGIEELFVEKWVSSLHKKIEMDLGFGAIRNSIFTKLCSNDNLCCPVFIKLCWLYISPMKEWVLDYGVEEVFIEIWVSSLHKKKLRRIWNS